MVQRLITVLILLVSSSYTLASDGGWVGQWVKKEQTIDNIKKEAVEEHKKTECTEKLKAYKQKLAENPKSEFYAVKVAELTEDCKKNSQ